uniref:Uncharacterized protein n=1 Tax=Onchocerca volvulus TaxID=6282 RepID=A0A8R1XS94_ONCVO
MIYDYTVMLRELFSVIILCAICSAVPTDNNEPEIIRVKRFGLFGDYNPYMNSSPYTYKVKTPFFKVKVKSNQGNFYGHPPYGFGGFYPPFGAGAFHPQPSIPYGYQHNPHGYGWFG